MTEAVPFDVRKYAANVLWNLLKKSIGDIARAELIVIEAVAFSVLQREGIG